jgi:anti-anti-sigma factor
VDIIKSDGETTIFSLSGKLDTNSGPKLEQAILEYFEGVPEPFEIDMANVSYVSSAGLRALLTAQKKANAKKITMTIKNVNKPIQEIFDITGYSGILTIE